MIRRLFPHPALAVLLFLVWILLANTLSAGTIVMALLIGVIVPLITAPYWRDKQDLVLCVGCNVPKVLKNWSALKHSRCCNNNAW